MAVTTVTLATGRVVDVEGRYEDIKATLTARALTADDGRRELRKTDGGWVTLNVAAIAAVEERAADTATRIGFR